MLEEKAPKFQAFTQVGYNGAHVILDPGRRYSSLVDMGLENPVMSLRTFDKVISRQNLRYFLELLLQNKSTKLK